MKRINDRQAIILHTSLVQMYGGITGIRDIDMLKSALESPFQTWGGKDLYKTLEEKAIHLCYSIVKIILC